MSAKLETDGRIVADYECFCATCDEYLLGLGRSKVKATKELRQQGWRRHFIPGRRGARWLCQRCHAAREPG